MLPLPHGRVIPYHREDEKAALARGDGPRASMKGNHMIKDIVKDEEFLSKPAEPATPEDANVAQDLLDTMAASEDCAGLAANQIGSTKAIIAFLGAHGPQVMYNPKIVATMVPYKVSEGCLSLDRETVVQRFQLIRVQFDALVDGKFESRTRKLTGWVAEVVQHGVDHCAGKLV